MPDVVVTTITPTSEELAAQIADHEKIKAQLANDLDYLDRTISATPFTDSKAASLAQQAAGLSAQLRVAQMRSDHLAKAHFGAKTGELTSEFHRLWDEWEKAFDEARELDNVVARLRNRVDDTQGRANMLRRTLRDQHNSLGHWRERRTPTVHWNNMYATIDEQAAKLVEAEKSLSVQREAFVADEAKLHELWRFVDMHQADMVRIADELLALGGTPPAPLYKGLEVPPFLVRPYGPR